MFDRRSVCIVRMNEAQGFSIELFAVDVAAESHEAFAIGG